MSRRVLVSAAFILGVGLIGLVALALANPWRLTGLYPLAHQAPTTIVLSAAGLLLGLAAAAWTAPSPVARSGWRRPGERYRWLAAAALLVGLPVLVGLGAPGLVGDWVRRGDDGQVLAVSPDGGFSAALSTSDSDDGATRRIYIRHRAGPFTREAAIPVAECPFDPFGRGVPPESVRFTSETTIAIPLADQPTTVVRFDPHTLAPERTVAMCPATGGS
jgi:hypothetical protein